MADQQLEDNKLPVRKWLRGHYMQIIYNGMRYGYVAICRHCSGEIFVHRSTLSMLRLHLMEEHLEVLTEEQKKDKNVYWAWDYFTPKPHKEIECHICSSILIFKNVTTLTRHLDIHRRQ